MIKRPVPFQRMAFVCTHSRPEGHPKPSCGRRGGPELREKLRALVEERGLQMSVKIFQAGCMGGCEFGPMMMTVDDRQMAFQVTEDDLPAILDELAADLPDGPAGF